MEKGGFGEVGVEAPCLWNAVTGLALLWCSQARLEVVNAV